MRCDFFDDKGFAAVPAGQYMTFLPGGGAYAIGILSIKEIIEQGQMTRVPMILELIRGVISSPAWARRGTSSW